FGRLDEQLEVQLTAGANTFLHQLLELILDVEFEPLLQILGDALHVLVHLDVQVGLERLEDGEEYPLQDAVTPEVGEEELGTEERHCLGADERDLAFFAPRQKIWTHQERRREQVAV